MPMLPRCLSGNQAKLHAELLGTPAEDQVTSSPASQLAVDGSARRLLCSSNEKQTCQSPESAQQARRGSQEAQEARVQEPPDACSQILPADRALPTRKRKKNAVLREGGTSWLPNAGTCAESLPAPGRVPHVNITAEAGGRQARLVQPERSSKRRRKQHSELCPLGLQEQQQQAVPTNRKEAAGAACSNDCHATGREAGAQLQCHPSGITATQIYSSIAMQHPDSSPRPAAAGKQQPGLEAVSAANPGWTQKRTSAAPVTAGEIDKLFNSELQTMAAS